MLSALIMRTMITARWLGATAAWLIPTLWLSLSAQPQTVQLPDLLLPQSDARSENSVIARFRGVYRDERLKTLVERIVARLVAVSGRSDLHFDATILNSAAVNAFIDPEGHLYVTRGLIALTNDPSELASALAHEIAHIVAGHQLIDDATKRNPDVQAGETQNPSNALAVARYKITLAAFSRAQELEADRLGVDLAALRPGRTATRFAA